MPFTFGRGTWGTAPPVIVVSSATLVLHATVLALSFRLESKGICGVFLQVIGHYLYAVTTQVVSVAHKHLHVVVTV